MKDFYLRTSTTREADILASQVKEFCKNKGYSFVFHNDHEKGFVPMLLICLSRATVHGMQLSTKDAGAFTQTIRGVKKIRQYLLGNTKENQEDYWLSELMKIDGFDSDNYARKAKVDLDSVRRFTGKAVVVQTPVHLLDERVQVLNLEKKERDRIYLVKDSRKPYRKFNGQHNRHCSKCPFPEGCVMCTLP